MAATGVGSGLSASQIAQIRRWASGHVGDGSGELSDAAREIVRLADLVEALRHAENDGELWAWDDGDEAGEPPDAASADLTTARRLLGQLDGAEPDERAVARALAILCEELEARGAVRADAPPGGGKPPGPLQGVSPLALAPTGLLLVIAIVIVIVARAAAPDLAAAGPDTGALVGRSALPALSFSVGGDPARFSDVRWTIDGNDVTSDARRVDDRLVLKPTALADGAHTVRAHVGGLALWSGSSASWHFTVDTRPPLIGLSSDTANATVRTSFALRVPIEDAATVTVDGKPVSLVDGAITLHGIPPAQFVVVARDRAGNVSNRHLMVDAAPREPPNPVRAVHVSADAWANAKLRDAVLALISAHKINTVELDLKDEFGIVGWDAPVPLAQRIGAVQKTFDLAAAVKELHARGVRVVGRLVVFRDPVLATWAWRAHKRDEVIQTPGGKPYTGVYCQLACFTSFANPKVRQYNIDIGVAAAELGVDDVLYDYIRRPDGPIDSMRFPGFKGDPADSIVSFLAETRRALAPTKTLLGVSVFGIAVMSPDEVAQDVPKMARQVDYVAPLVYPSHWAPGEYGVANPNAQPYDIVLASLRDFRRAVQGTGARLVPWLQDFSLGMHYGPTQVRAQISAAHDAGIDEWILWDPNVTYTAGALSTGAPLPTVGTDPPAVTVVSSPKLAPNELGAVPVLMFHQIRPDPTSEFDETPNDFRTELARLYREGYRPITASDLVNRHINVPKGTTPVVLSFDDAYANQAALRADGTIDPSTAVGILLAFARTHPGFRPVATFYVNREPFAAGDRTQALLKWLVVHGFEIANHTKDHANLRSLDARAVKAELLAENDIIHSYLPGLPIETMALPYGALPKTPGLALAGRSSDGQRYAFKGVMLVGAGPAPSPFSSSFDPGAIPRIRSATQSVAYDANDWLDRLDVSPGERYVSDGDPNHVTFPKALFGKLAPAYAAQAKSY